MTIELAKKRLEVWLKCVNCPEDIRCYDEHLHTLCDDYDFGEDVSLDETIKVAISALSAIEDIKAEIKAEWKDIDDVCIQNGLSIALRIIDRHISKVGTLMPLPEWILCSERMPQVTGYYLIQHTRAICADEMAVAFYSVEEAEVDSNYTWEFKTIADVKEVIAWMPLPEPYKAEGSDTE